MTHFSRAIALTITVLFVHALALGYGWYARMQSFDAVMHFAGGFAMAYLGTALWHFVIAGMQVSGRGPFARIAPMLVRLLFIMGFVALIGIAWEWFEFACDQLFPRLVDQYQVAQPSIRDTMADLFLDLFGGLTAFVLIKRSRLL